ncbi:UNVERIFIED_CONTAM: hypothetical protein Sindi_2856300 [Sesamum indicum]
MTTWKELVAQGGTWNMPKASWARERSVTAFSNIRTRKRTISRAEVETVGKQIEKLKEQLDDLKKRGDLVRQNRNSPFASKILMEVVRPNFGLLDLPKYDGLKDPWEHISAVELVMNLYGLTDSINAKLLMITLIGKAQEWRFNDEILEGQDLRIDMMTSMLIHELKKGPFASALARDQPGDTKHLIHLARKYIDEESNAIRTEWN